MRWHLPNSLLVAGLRVLRPQLYEQHSGQRGGCLSHKGSGLTLHTKNQCKETLSCLYINYWAVFTEMFVILKTSFLHVNPHHLPAEFPRHRTVTLEQGHRDFISALTGSTRPLHSLLKEE